LLSGLVKGGLHWVLGSHGQGMATRLSGRASGCGISSMSGHGMNAYGMGMSHGNELACDDEFKTPEDHFDPLRFLLRIETCE
jgi:hypothetical protein